MEITPSRSFLIDLTEKYLDGVKQWSLSAEYFNELFRQEPEQVRQIAEKVGITIDALLAGNVDAAQKFMIEDQDLKQAFKKRLQNKNPDPILPTTKTIQALQQNLLGQTTLEAITAEEYRLTEHLLDATTFILATLGFVHTDTYFQPKNKPGTPGEGQKYEHPDDMPKHIALPYDEIVMVRRFTRGTEEAQLTAIHESIEDVREGFYKFYMLYANAPIIDGPIITVEEAYQKFPKTFEIKNGRLVKKDPLTEAARNGYTVHGKNTYVHHLANILNRIAEMLDGDVQDFLLASAGIKADEIERPDYNELAKQVQKKGIMSTLGKGIPENDDSEPETTEEVRLDFNKTVKANLKPYLPILRTPNARRLRDIKSLGNVYHLRQPSAQQSRHEHSVGGMYIAGLICDRLGIKGKDKTKVEAYALVHDWGHLTGSHATEFYFKALMGFDHDEFAKQLIKQNAQAFEGIVEPDALIAMFEGKDPLSTIMSGPFGADRIYYLSIDPHEYGKQKKYDSTDILKWLTWTGELAVSQMPEKAFRFLDFRAQQYEDLYFAPTTQIADAYQRKMLMATGIKSPFESIHIRKEKGSQVLLTDHTAPLWQLTDTLWEHHLAMHQNPDISEIMRHLIYVYNRAPHSTAAVLKIKGYEETEPFTKMTDYQRLKFHTVPPSMEGITEEEMKKYSGQWFNPQKQRELEKELAKRIGMPERHIIVAAVPEMKKLATEHAPVQIGNEVKSLFEWNPEYSKPFQERAKRMACIRAAFHPQLLPFAIEYFRENSFAEIVKQVYG